VNQKSSIVQYCTYFHEMLTSFKCHWHTQ